MPEHLKALVVILGLATAVFFFSKTPACAAAFTLGDFNRRRNLWFGVTLAAFLAHNFWVYITLAGIMLLIAAQRESNKLALYFFVLFAVPPISAQITGMGVIQHFFTIDYLRLLALVVLFPAFLVLRRQPDSAAFGSTFPDKLLAGYLILQVILMMTVGSFTNTLRMGVFYAFIDVFLPYYVASRLIKDVQGFRDALMGFVMAALLLAVIGTFEFLRNWLLYASLDGALGAPWDMGSYLARADEGSALRAQGSTGQPIPFGYVMAVAIGFLLYLRTTATAKFSWNVALLVLGAGLLASLSRGPWVGAAAIVMVFIATGRSPIKGFITLGLLGLLAIPLLMATGSGSRFLDLLPFIGNVSADNVTYRQRLAEISIQVIMQNPFFGAFDYFYSPAMQDLRHGEGIIDIVNTYLAIGLGNGLVGLALFTGFFIAVVWVVFRGMRTLPDRDDERYTLGRSLFATLLGILLTIATVSSITIIPVIYWAVAGLGVAYVRMLSPAPAPVAAQPAGRQSAAPNRGRRAPTGDRAAESRT